MVWGDGAWIGEVGVGLRTFRLTCAIVAALVLAACAHSSPDIGSHLPGTFAVASDAFDRRIKARFPVGSAVTALRVELERERFVIAPDTDSPLNFSARYHASELACAADWVIRWSAVDGKIANIKGSYREVCL
jgi:hypothetical protein